MYQAKTEVERLQSVLSGGATKFGCRVSGAFSLEILPFRFVSWSRLQRNAVDQHGLRSCRRKSRSKALQVSHIKIGTLN